MEHFILGDGAARLGGLEGGAGGKLRVKGIKRRLGGRGECRNRGRCCGQGLELADVIFRKLPEFLGADAAIFQMVFKESIDVYHRVVGLSGSNGKAK